VNLRRQAQTYSFDQTRARDRVSSPSTRLSHHQLSLMASCSRLRYCRGITLPRPSGYSGRSARRFLATPSMYIASGGTLSRSGTHPNWCCKRRYLPQFSLTGLAVNESTNPRRFSLAEQHRLAGHVCCRSHFTGGRLKANVDQAQASYRQSVSQYEKTRPQNRCHLMQGTFEGATIKLAGWRTFFHTTWCFPPPRPVRRGEQTQSRCHACRGSPKPLHAGLVKLSGRRLCQQTLLRIKRSQPRGTR